MHGRSTRLLIAVALVGLLGLLPSLAAAAPAAVERSRIYMIALEDNGASGTPVGCSDSLVPVMVDVPEAAMTAGKITQALTRLFSLRDRLYGESGLYNALYNSRLTVDRVELQGGTAAVYLSGSVSLGGVCDDPRAEGQIAATARQFPGVTNAIIILNGGPLVSAVGGIDFPETGHRVEAPFYPFWEVQGGLPIFGYPLTGQLVEGGFRAQYFERQRFEHHPENAAPYNVLFGLVGSEAAERRELTGRPAFARSPARNTPDCEYFAATGHNVCGKLRAYWHDHGLDFGEPGFSFRESLALFGFPISELFEEQLEDGRTYQVQYFERVRMELHPENQPPYDVLLGRLAVRALPVLPQ